MSMLKSGWMIFFDAYTSDNIEGSGGIYPGNIK